jgi:hypothetical protein
VEVKKRPITPKEGQRIVDEARTWAGTPYLSAGANSTKKTDEKNGGADCSGSTYYIYKNVGFQYGPEYQMTTDFKNYVKGSESHFIKIANIENAQPGDILLWPKHMAIYAIFSSDDPERVKFFNKKKQDPNMWTAFHSGGPVYGPMRWQWWSECDSPEIYRYQIIIENNGE